jgi:hypothetical protein
MQQSSEYGIFDLSIVPIRSEASDKAELVNQGLFGEAFEILETTNDKKWLRIKLHHDKYEGWIDHKQCKLIDKSYFEQYSQYPHPYSYQGISIVSNGSGSFPIIAGSTLPFLNEEHHIFIGDEIFEFQTPIDHQEPEIKSNFDHIAEYALSYLHAPYLWGGRTYFGIDCSGFVQQVFKKINIMLPRDAREQIEIGLDIEHENIQSGDLAFFANKENKIVHVGILLNSQEIIHASGEVRIDEIKSEGIWNQQRQELTHLLHSFKRII